METGIRITDATFGKYILVQKYAGKRLWLFNKWVTVQRYSNTLEGRNHAHQLAKNLSNGYNFKVDLFVV